MLGKEVTNLVFDVEEVTIDNYHEHMVKSMGVALEHLRQHRFAKSVFCSLAMLPEEPSYVRVDLTFVTYEPDAETPDERNKQYRLVWCKFNNLKMATVYATHISQAIALSCCNETGYPWGAINVGQGVISIAPSIVINKVIKNKDNNATN